MACTLIDFAFVVLKLLMFKICGITGITIIDFFNFQVLKGLRYFHATLIKSDLAHKNKLDVPKGLSLSELLMLLNQT